MESGLIIIAIVSVVIAAVAVVMCLKFRQQSSKLQDVAGVLNVVCEKLGDQPELFLGLGVPVEDIVSQKQVIFTVNVIRENSHK